jgi:hypothetical protein
MATKRLKTREGWDELFEAQHVGMAYEKMGLLPSDGSALPTATSEPAPSALNALMMNVNPQFLLDGGRSRPLFLVKHFTSATDLDLIDGCLEEEVQLTPSPPDADQGTSLDAADAELRKKAEEEALGARTHTHSTHTHPTAHAHRTRTAHRTRLWTDDLAGKWQDTKVVVLEARDMRPGKSRPKALAANIYCVVTSVSRLRQSSVCWHTPHPVWNEQYFVGVSGMRISPSPPCYCWCIGAHRAGVATDSISVQVLDKSESAASDDLLGVIDVRHSLLFLLVVIMNVCITEKGACCLRLTGASRSAALRPRGGHVAAAQVHHPQRASWYVTLAQLRLHSIRSLCTHHRRVLPHRRDPRKDQEAIIAGQAGRPPPACRRLVR